MTLPPASGSCQEGIVSVNQLCDAADRPGSSFSAPAFSAPTFSALCPVAESRRDDAAPLNRDREFLSWPHFNPGQWIDTKPGFVRLGADAAWAVFTRYALPPQPGSGSIWAVRVDAQMQPVGLPIPILGHGTDPRVIRLGEHVLVFHGVIDRDGNGAINGSSVALAEFVVRGDLWVRTGSFRFPKQPIAGALPEGVHPDWAEHWVPFAIQPPEGGARIGLIYSHAPWNVMTLRVDPGAPRRFEALHSGAGIQWECGTIRGGTPPVAYDAAHLVTFFHAAQVMGSRNVSSVGACVFQARPPYAPVLMTAEPLLVAPYRTGVHRFGWQFAASVVLPLGAERTEAGYRLLCGRDDGEIAPFLVRHDELAARLAPPGHGAAGTLHDYRGGKGARLSLRRLLYVPDSAPVMADLPMVNFLRMIAGRGRCLIDVGAGIGAYTMGLAPGFDRVLAFEPERGHDAWLRRNAALNDHEHVRCEPLALGDTPGDACAGVAAEALDARGLTDVDLLRIAVQGREIAVLRGAARIIAASRPVILLAAGEDQARRQDVQAVMSGMGYGLEFLFPFSPGLALCLPQERRDAYRWFL